MLQILDLDVAVGHQSGRALRTHVDVHLHGIAPRQGAQRISTGERQLRITQHHDIHFVLLHICIRHGFNIEVHSSLRGLDVLHPVQCLQRLVCVGLNHLGTVRRISMR